MRMTMMDDHDFDVEERASYGKASGNVTRFDPIEEDAIGVLDDFHSRNEKKSALTTLVSELFDSMSLSCGDVYKFNEFCHEIYDSYFSIVSARDESFRDVDAKRRYAELIEFFRALTVKGFVCVTEHPEIFTYYGLKFDLLRRVCSAGDYGLNQCSYAVVNSSLLEGDDAPIENVTAILRSGRRVSGVLKSSSEFNVTSDEFIACCQVYSRSFSQKTRDPISRHSGSVVRLERFISKFFNDEPNPNYREDDDIALSLMPPRRDRLSE